MEQDGKGKIISNPRVLTTNNVEALIEQGTEIPYQQATSSGATSVSFRKATLKLEVTPQITPEGAIFLDVRVNDHLMGEKIAAPIDGPVTVAIAARVGGTRLIDNVIL